MQEFRAMEAAIQAAPDQQSSLTDPALTGDRGDHLAAPTPLPGTRSRPAGLTPLPLGHESFAIRCPLALVGHASYPVLVHRPAASIHASSPWSVTLPQLRFTSLTVTRPRRDSHPLECAHAGRTTQKAPPFWGGALDQISMCIEL